jgi:DNA-binding NarL/FixJ family response regulator
MESGIEGGLGPRKTRVLLVDDQIAVREMVAMVLDREGSFATVAEAGTGVEGLKLFRKYRPDLVVTALALPEMNGPDLIREMRAENADQRVIVFTATKNRDLARQGIEAAPQGFIHKGEPLLTLRRALGAVSEGQGFFGPFATRLLGEMRGASREDSVLTPKQRIVLQMIAEGASTKQVATRLSLSPKTVEHYRTQVMQRLGLRDIASLTRYAVRSGLISAD